MGYFEFGLNSPENLQDRSREDGNVEREVGCLIPRTLQIIRTPLVCGISEPGPLNRRVDGVQHIEYEMVLNSG
ncbi:hypothetical protein KL930_005138 [Ogataea haglerorum]|uniref:Uncharacterized protein n=1 Tax=Ogataea haglerorum TaxID=1937702 RepID=A0AAN6HYE5_9ASCO|nr:uncharacterized protein KL911_005149 [Ogataea haglerorum]KAG7692200.1 hypothetical protein KL951_005109 [Ogataea haglerorum]KAG7693765.1 hypothetical protein KL915_004055 [Ogataea haglerorum]KAG7702709.1 hypothetical protein KL914_005096 [Ogataea haglerorum]KAG7702801.1 hypothetical protein KL950_005070 [Ogataea haglerorum]KAG7713397.1 hypothetical protein KL913_005018 [Ogataea haglerorum]